MGVERYITAIWQSLQRGVLGTIGGIGVTDLLDMLIVAFVLYKIMQFLKKSRLGLVAKSILILLALVWISGRFNLMVINFATSRAVEMGILALVILFQQEIRQALERIGRNNLGVFFDKEAPMQEMEAVIAQTVVACAQMAKARLGALIVFERKVSLEEETKTGTLLDARISAELLGNIFYDKAPLHDGAVIIRGDRIISASAMLPLTDNATLSRDLGMRHRAGIGVSEHSDAVVVIVSEETGAISVALNGILRRHLSLDGFEQLLKAELLTEEHKQRTTFIHRLKGKI